MKGKVPVGSYGNYNNQVCVGGFRPTIEGMYCTHSPHGLSLSGAYLYGTFRDEDGGIFAYMRVVLPQAIPMVYLWYKAPEAAPIIHPAANEFLRGMCTNRLLGDKIQIRSFRNTPGPVFTLQLDTERFHCVEEGKLELSGTRVGVGGDFFWPDARQDVYYSSIFFEVESGTILGRRVRGGIAWDQVYGPTGYTWATMRPYIGPGNDVEVVWVSGINVYEDGEREMYHVAAGKGDWGWLFATSGDEVTAMSRSVTATPELDDDGLHPGRVLFSTDCGDWEFTAIPNCHLISPISPKDVPLHWVEGVTQRVGERRGARITMGWIDFFPARLEYLKKG